MLSLVLLEFYPFDLLDLLELLLVLLNLPLEALSLDDQIVFLLTQTCVQGCQLCNFHLVHLRHSFKTLLFITDTLCSGFVLGKLLVALIDDAINCAFNQIEEKDLFSLKVFGPA